MTKGWDNVEPVWFCEGLPESGWRRVAALWGAPAIPSFGFPRAVGAAAILAKGASTADEPDDNHVEPRKGSRKSWQNLPLR